MAGGPVAVMFSKAFKSPHIMFLLSAFGGGSAYAVFFSGFNIFRGIDVDFNKKRECPPEELVQPTERRNLFVHHKQMYKAADKELEELRKELGPFKRA